MFELACLILALCHAQDLQGLLAPASFGLFAIVYFSRLRVPKRLDATSWLLILLVVWLLVSTVFNGTWQGVTVAEYVSHYCQMFYMVGFYLVMRFIRYNERLELNIYRSVIAAAVLFSLMSLFSFFVHPLVIMDVKFSGLGYVYGPFGAHDPMAAMVGVAFVLTWVALGRRRESPYYAKIMPWWLHYACLGVLGVTFAMARSRGYTVGLGMALFIPILWQAIRDINRRSMGRRVIVGGLASLVICVGFGIVMSDRIATIFQSGQSGAISDDPNVETRLLLWARALGLSSQSVLTGVGPGAFEQVSLKLDPVIPVLVSHRSSGQYLDTKIAFDPNGGLHAHDVFLEILVEWGLFGFTLIFAAFASAMLAAKRAIKRYDAVMPDTGRRQFLYELSWGLFLYLAGSGITGGYTFMSPTTAWLFFFVIARIRAGNARDAQMLASMSQAGAA